MKTRTQPGASKRDTAKAQPRQRKSKPRDLPRGVVVKKSGIGASIKAGGKYYWLGTFNTTEDAGLAYDAAARFFFGDKAVTNAPSGPALSPEDIKGGFLFPGREPRKPKIKCTRGASRPDGETLRRLYWEEGKAIWSMAVELGVHASSIRAWMEEEGIPKRTRAQADAVRRARRGSGPKKRPSNAELARLYELGISTYQIARAFRLDSNSVRRWLLKAEVVLRKDAFYRKREHYSGPTPSEQELREVYIEEDMGLEEVAHHFGAPVYVLWNWLLDAGIPVRIPRDTELLFRAGTPQVLERIEDDVPYLRVELRPGEVILIDEPDFERIKSHCWRIGSQMSVLTHMQKRVVRLGRYLLPEWRACHHLNGDRLDYRRSNLVDDAVRGHRGVTLGRALPRGVRKYGQRFRAGATFEGKSYHLGVFDRVEEASAAYDRASVLLYGGGAVINGEEGESASISFPRSFTNLLKSRGISPDVGVESEQSQTVSEALESSHLVRVKKSTKPPSSKRPPRETLVELYVEQEFGKRELAEYFGVSRVSINNWLGYHNIPTRTQSEELRRVNQAARKARSEPLKEALPVTSDDLWDMHWGDRMSVANMAEELGVPLGDVMRWMRSLGVPLCPKKAPRKEGDPNDELLRHLREVLELPVRDLCRCFGVYHEKMVSWLKEAGALSAIPHLPIKPISNSVGKTIKTLYLRKNQTLEEVASGVGLPARDVVRWLLDAGVELDWTREPAS